MNTMVLNKPKGLKVAKEELRSIGLMVDRLDVESIVESLSRLKS